MSTTNLLHKNLAITSCDKLSAARTGAGRKRISTIYCATLNSFIVSQQLSFSSFIFVLARHLTNVRRQLRRSRAPGTSPPPHCSGALPYDRKGLLFIIIVSKKFQDWKWKLNFLYRWNYYSFFIWTRLRSKCNCKDFYVDYLCKVLAISVKFAIGCKFTRVVMSKYVIRFK